MSLPSRPPPVLPIVEDLPPVWLHDLAPIACIILFAVPGETSPEGSDLEHHAEDRENADQQQYDGRE